MRELFPGWTPADPQTLERYWGEATLAVDTSVLLDLYRFSHEARSGLLEALRSFGDRLWVPHQVAYEFHRNRLGVLLDQREAEGALLGELDSIRNEIDEQLSKRLRVAGRRDLAPLREAIDGGFERLREQLEEAEKAHTQGLGDSIRDDPIYDEVVALCGERVGDGFDETRLAEVCADAEKRLGDEVPPGYLDAKKTGDARFGDVIIWHQLCDKASESGLPIVLIADDQKEDWLWEVRGKTLGPRPELVAEMRDRAGTGFHIYTPARFLQVWKEREEGGEVEQEVLDEIEGPPPEANQGPHEGGRSWSTLVADFATAFANWPTGVVAVGKHRFAEGSVELSLVFMVKAKHEPPSQIRVAVADPTGRIFIRKASVETELGRHTAHVWYPQHFGGPDHLLPGQYTVEWFASGFNRDRTEEERRIAAETFVLPPSSSR